MKYVSAKEAVRHINSGDRVVIGHACGEPSKVIEALVSNAADYENVEIVHMVAMGKAEYCKPEYEKNFIHNALFAGAPTRVAIAEGRGDFTPCFFFEIPRLFKDNILPIDVALVTVTPPDKFGYCSTGISVDYTIAAIKSAKTVIAQVNENMPRTYGESLIHISEIDYGVLEAEPIIELPRAKLGETERKIGENCAKLIKDGATLQLGIGGIPDAVLSFLTDKNDLGIHSEMFSDGVLELVEKGNINNKAKTLHKDKFAAAFLMGSKKLYDFSDENPEVLMMSVDYINNPYIIAQNFRMTSINSALQVDLMGQVNAETISHKQFSATGGQVDFVRGASFAKEGVSIIALPSTASKGTLSRITATLDEGAAVTTLRNDVQYIVTEYGIADLRGKTLRQRARELIAIAHPDFRDELFDFAKTKFNKF